MTRQRYEIYDFGLTDRPNFFLTKVLQKQRFFKIREEDPYAYIPVIDSRIILGQDNLYEKINKLIYDGYIESVIIGKTKFSKPMVGYIPLKTEYTRTMTSAYFAFNYYKNRLVQLSRYANEIVRRLRDTEVLIPDWDEILIECYDAYLAKGGEQHFERYVENLKWLQEEVLCFNSASVHADYVKEDVFGQRVHSFISQLPRPMRKYVFIGGYPTVEVDLSQSQPLILSKHLDNELGNNSFSRIVQETDIYTYIQEFLGLATREYAKTALYRMLYGAAYTEMAKVFYRLFPDTKDYIVHLKTIKNYSNPSVKIHSNLAFQMQRAETAIFRIVWDKLMANRIPYLSIHDGLLVKAQDAERVKEYMTVIITRHLGSSVVVNIK